MFSICWGWCAATDRDIKPENLMMTSYDDHADVKIVDFGFAAFAEGTTLTDRCGTPYYISPELLNRIPHGAQCFPSTN